MAGRPSRHGLRALKAVVSVRGISAIDRRSIAGRSLLAWRAELLSDLGGEDNVSSQKHALVDLAARTRLIIDHLDSYILEQPSLVNRRKKSLLPVVKERQTLVDSLARLLTQIGLERVPKPVQDLRSYLAAKAAEGESPRPSRDEPEPEEISDAEPPETSSEEERA